MATLIFCANKKCIHLKKWKKDLFQCGREKITIGFNGKNQCDDYTIPPLDMVRLIEKAEACHDGDSCDECENLQQCLSGQNNSKEE